MSRTVMSPIAITVTIPATGTASELIFRDTLTVRSGLIVPIATGIRRRRIAAPAH